MGDCVESLSNGKRDDTACPPLDHRQGGIYHGKQSGWIDPTCLVEFCALG